MRFTPPGAAGDVWSTFAPAEFEVLAVARSVPTAGRLLDTAHVFAGDARVGITFTVNPGSVSEAGVEPMLRAAGVERLVPWEEAVAGRDRYALALSASPKDGLHRLATAGSGPPLLLMPHGAGHNRRVGDRPGDLETASGLDASQLLHDGRPVPSAFAFSHPEQVGRLHRAPALRTLRAEVVGDVAFDRIAANAGRRDRFRRALGVPDGGRLVAVSSTWNRDSLLGSQRDALRALLAALPAEEYKVALIAHPNVWYRHGRHHMELLLREEIDSGLALIAPHEGWRAAVIAADALVGDHGSTTYYTAAFGRPVLLAAFGGEDLDPESPLLDFGARTPRLRLDRTVRAQVESAIGAAGTAPDQAVDLLIAHPGEAAHRLRSLCYTLMGTSPIAEPPPLPALPAPTAFPGEATAWRVRATGGAELGAPVIRPHLHPAPVGPPSSGPLLVSVEDPSPERHDAAAALWRPGPVAEPEAVRWAADVLDRHPLCTLAVAALTDGEYLLALASSAWVRVAVDPPTADPLLVAAAATAWQDEEPDFATWRDKGAVLVAPCGRTALTVPPPPTHFG